MRFCFCLPSTNVYSSRTLNSPFGFLLLSCTSFLIPLLSLLSLLLLLCPARQSRHPTDLRQHVDAVGPPLLVLPASYLHLLLPFDHLSRSLYMFTLLVLSRHLIYLSPRPFNQTFLSPVPTPYACQRSSATDPPLMLPLFRQPLQPNHVRGGNVIGMGHRSQTPTVPGHNSATTALKPDMNSDATECTDCSHHPNSCAL